MRGVVRRLLVLQVVIAFSVTVSVYAKSTPIDDHLEPLDPIWKSYRQLLHSKLGVTPFDCGRAMVIPDLGPESSVSVYSGSSERGQQKCYVTFLLPSDSFWQNIKHPQRVRVRRFEAEIPQHTAHLLMETWIRMLKDTRRLSADYWSRQGEMDRSGLGDEYSIQRRDGHVLDGTLPEPHPGRKLQSLDRIRQLLEWYCQAAPTKRQAIARRIEEQAYRIVAH